MSKPENLRKDPLLQPLTIRGLTLKNRVMSTSHASAMDDDNMPALRYQRYHEEKAKGGLALTMFGGSSNIAPDSPSVFNQLNAGTDEIIPYFQEFAERIHQHGTALMCQITHMGRRGDAQEEAWLPTIAPSAVREDLHRNFARAMDDYDIDRVATGGMAAENPLPGADLSIPCWDMLSGDVRAEKEILVCDHTGRHEAVATADMLSASGHRVTLASIDSHGATEMGYTDRIVFHKRLAAQGVTTLAYLKLSAIRKDGNRLLATLTHELTGETQEIITDQVLLETGTEPLAEVFFELQAGSANKGISDVDAMAAWAAQPATPQGYTLHRLGDAVTSRSIHAALLEAYRLAVHV